MSIPSKPKLANIFGVEPLENFSQIEKSSKEMADQLQSDWKIKVIEADIEAKLETSKKEMVNSVEKASEIRDVKTPIKNSDELLEEIIKKQQAFLDNLVKAQIQLLRNSQEIAAKFNGNSYETDDLGRDMKQLRANIQLSAQYDSLITFWKAEMDNNALLVGSYKIAKQDTTAWDQSLDRKFATNIVDHFSETLEKAENDLDSSYKTAHEIGVESAEKQREILGKLFGNTTKAESEAVINAKRDEELANFKLKEKSKKPSIFKRAATLITGGLYKGGKLPDVSKEQKDLETAQQKNQEAQKKLLEKIKSIESSETLKTNIIKTPALEQEGTLRADINSNLEAINDNPTINQELQKRYILDAKQGINPVAFQKDFIEQLNDQLMLAKLVIKGIATGTKVKPEEYGLKAVGEINKNFSPPIFSQIVGVTLGVAKFVVDRKKKQEFTRINEAFEALDPSDIAEIGAYLAKSYGAVKDGTSPLDPLTKEDIKKLSEVAAVRIIEKIAAGKLTVEMLKSDQKMQYMFEAVTSGKEVKNTSLKTTDPKKYKKWTVQGLLSSHGIIDKNGNRYSHPKRSDDKYGFVSYPEGQKIPNGYVNTAQKDAQKTGSITPLLQKDVKFRDKIENLQKEENESKRNQASKIIEDLIKKLLLKDKKLTSEELNNKAKEITKKIEEIAESDQDEKAITKLINEKIPGNSKPNILKSTEVKNLESAILKQALILHSTKEAVVEKTKVLSRKEGVKALIQSSDAIHDLIGDYIDSHTKKKQDEISVDDITNDIIHHIMDCYTKAKMSKKKNSISDEEMNEIIEQIEIEITNLVTKEYKFETTPDTQFLTDLITHSKELAGQWKDINNLYPELAAQLSTQFYVSYEAEEPAVDNATDCPAKKAASQFVTKDKSWAEAFAGAVLDEAKGTAQGLAVAAAQSGLGRL